ncbi:hypothetical protein AHF37_07769, partial [Paragonimus kellicotti]
LGSNFPTHWIGANLQLIYKTEQDGYSLGTLYRKSKDVEGGVLLVIRDTLGTVFGAILSERIQCSKHFYGTGETCVFHWCPDFKAFKVRRAPGAAFRVTAFTTSDRLLKTSRSVESDFTLQPDFYAVRSRANSNRVSFAEDSEKQFVKVVAQRVLSSGELVDGVLLITPDSLCFDATLTAIAQKRAFLAAHPSISSDSNSKQGQTVCSKQEGIAKELLELGVCVPLETLSSMSTLKKLVQHTHDLGFHELTDSPIHESIECGPQAPEGKSPNSETVVTPETASVTDEDGCVVSGPDLTSKQSPQVDTEAGLSSQSSLSSGAHSPLHPVETFTRKYSFTLEAENALFLRLVQFSSGKAVNEYHFQIATEE